MIYGFLRKILGFKKGAYRFRVNHRKYDPQFPSPMAYMDGPYLNVNKGRPGLGTLVGEFLGVLVITLIYTMFLMATPFSYWADTIGGPQYNMIDGKKYDNTTSDLKRKGIVALVKTGINEKHLAQPCFEAAGEYFEGLFWFSSPYRKKVNLCDWTFLGAGRNDPIVGNFTD